MASNLEGDFDNLQLCDGIDPAHIGARHNDWVGPVTSFGKCDLAWEENLKSSKYVGDINFGRREWARSRDAVDKVMKMMLEEIRKEATKHEGLRIDSYIRQGSSRDGLKVVAADEFDSVLEFHIEGLVIEPEYVRKSGKLIPGFCFYKVSQPVELLEKRFPRLWKNKIFQKVGSSVYLSPKQLHERVMTSLVDTAVSVVSVVQRTLSQEENAQFTITRKKNPPAINLSIHLNADAHQADAVQQIDLDMVPAMLLRKDTTTTYEGQALNCPVHSVCKWAEGDTMKVLEFVQEKDLVWHINSAGYEKHTLDVARMSKDPKRQYILTALRIMKTFFEKTKRIVKEKKESPPQFISILKSYHLKHVAFYLMMYTCHLHNDIKIEGAQQALTYFIALLEAALEVEHLPHFFYSNSKITRMYPGFPKQGDLKYDHFKKPRLSPGSLMQALRTMQKELIKELKVDTKAIDPKMAQVVTEFKAEISKGEYF